MSLAFSGYFDKCEYLFRSGSLAKRLDGFVSAPFFGYVDCFDCSWNS